MRIEASIAAADAAKPRWDAVVVGAGPAGARLAGLAARAGLRVLLVDRQEFPRPKVCGGCVSARTLERLHDAGLGRALLRAGGRPLRTLRLAGWGSVVDLALPGGMSISRGALDAILLRDAIAAGSAFLPGRRARLGKPHGGSRELVLRGTSDEVTVRAALVVDASGLGGALIGTTGAASRHGRRIGCAAMVEASAEAFEPGRIYMAVARQGYVGAVRVEDGRLNVAAAFDRDAVRRTGLAATASAVLRRAGLAAPDELSRADWSSTPCLWQRPAARAAQRLLAIGDAAGYIEPFTGEGIGWALRSAELAAPLVVRACDGWSDELAAQWNDVYRRELGASQRGCRALARLLRYPLPTRAALAMLRWRPALGGPLVRRLHGGRWAADGAV